MPIGRKRLDPETLAFNRQETLNRYAEKYIQPHFRSLLDLSCHARNKAKLREATRLQTVRRSKQQICQKFKLKSEEISALKLKTGTERPSVYAILCSGQEREGLEAFNAKQSGKTMRKTQLKHEGRAVAHRPKSLPKMLKHRKILSESTSEKESSEESDRGGAVPDARPFFAKRIDRRTDAEHRADWEATCAALQQHMFEVRRAGLLRLLQMSPPTGAILLCVPCYSPDIGHEDPMKHSSDPDGVFYAIDSAAWRGIVTSKWQRVPGADAQDISRHLIFRGPDVLGDHEALGPEMYGLPLPWGCLSDVQRPVVAIYPGAFSAKPALISDPNDSHGSSHSRRQTPATTGSAARSGTPHSTPSGAPRATPRSPITAYTHPRYNSAAEEQAELEDLFAQTSIDALRAAAVDSETCEGHSGPRYDVPCMNYAHYDVDIASAMMHKAIKVFKKTPDAEFVFMENDRELKEFILQEARGAKNNKRKLLSRAKKTKALAAAKARQNRIKLYAEVTSRDTQYKSTCKVTLRNTIVHDLALKAHASGNFKKKLHVLQSEVIASEDTVDPEDCDDDSLDDTTYAGLVASLSEAEKKRLITQLEENRLLKRCGPRATNKAAQADGIATINGVRDSMLDLCERTGIRGFTFFLRGHPDDVVLPMVVDSDEAALFFPQVIGKTKYEILRLLEQWSCAMDAGTVHVYIGNAKHNRKLVMSYTNYNANICKALGVELRGWPKDIKFRRPAKLLTDDARKIRDMLRAGDIKWVRMSAARSKELADEFDACTVAGLPFKKTRGPGKNTKGKGKAKATEDSDEEDSSSEEREDDDDSDEEEDTEEPAPRCALSLRVEELQVAQGRKHDARASRDTTTPSGATTASLITPLGPSVAVTAPSASPPTLPNPADEDAPRMLRAEFDFDNIPVYDSTGFPTLDLDDLASSFGQDSMLPTSAAANGVDSSSTALSDTFDLDTHLTYNLDSMGFGSEYEQVLNSLLSTENTAVQPYDMNSIMGYSAAIDTVQLRGWSAPTGFAAVDAPVAQSEDAHNSFAGQDITTTYCENKREERGGK
ncbi:hypothetical protein C8R43DRAFT_941739 [Mycena crocata]|nr:hypothetical protein C8R43DRAFT_941739 [Mycena crocata]